MNLNTEERWALELWRDRDQAATEAARDEESLNRFVAENRRFIIRCASRTCRRFITESDDEYEVALVAFVEAIKSFDPEAGGFDAFATMVIRRRLLDHFDRVSRRRREVSAGSAMNWDDDVPTGVMAQVQQAIVQESEQAGRDVKDEIAAITDILKEYGFTFFDVAEASPRTTKTRGFCARAVNWMLALVERIFKMRQRHSLPTAQLCDDCDLSRKVVDRHRRYIIAATEILDGDFPQLSEYLQYIRKYREE